MRSLSPIRADQRGYTLAELLVAIAIVGLVMTGLLTLLKKGNESYLAGANQVEAQSATRAALERMTQEIREAGYNPQGLPPCVPPTVPPACMDAVVNATATGFTIQNDWNGNGLIDPAPAIVCVTYTWAACPAPPGSPNLRGEQITYSIVGGTLQRQESSVNAAPVPILTNVAQANLGGIQPFFQYQDVGGCLIGACINPITGAATTQADIRTVVVNLQAGVQQNPAPAVWQTGAIQVTMSDRIRLRNRTP